MVNNLQQMHLKLLQNKQFKKQQKQPVIGNEIEDKITNTTSQCNPEADSQTGGKLLEIPKERYTYEIHIIYFYCYSLLTLFYYYYCFLNFYHCFHTIIILRSLIYHLIN